MAGSEPLASKWDLKCRLVGGGEGRLQLAQRAETFPGQQQDGDQGRAGQGVVGRPQRGQGDTEQGARGHGQADESDVHLAEPPSEVA